MTWRPFVANPLQVWLLWQKSKATASRPSEFLWLDPGSYEAYCLDEAVIYFGLTLENMLESAGQKPGKEERRAEMARKHILDRVFGGEEKKGTGYADPALMFN